MKKQFIVESRRPGEPVRYITSTQVRNEYILAGWQTLAHKFDSKAMAQVAARRFSSAYNLIVTEVKDGNGK